LDGEGERPNGRGGLAKQCGKLESGDQRAYHETELIFDRKA